MNLNSFQKNFQVRDFNIKPYLMVVSIFIVLILIIMIFNNSLDNYYICEGKIIDNKIKVIVDYQNLAKITNNKEFKIERNIFTYKVSEIKEIYNDSYYFELTLEVNKIKDDIFINNNIIKLKIITNKSTLFDYFIKALKGE